MLAGSLGMLPSASLGDRAHRARRRSASTSPSTAPSPDIDRPGRGQPGGDDPLGRDAAALVARPGGRRRGHRDRPFGRRSRTAPHGRPLGADGERSRLAPRRHRRVRRRRRRPRARLCHSRSSTMSSHDVSARRRAGRPLRHHPPRRHAGRGHHALAGRQAQDRAHARRVGMPYIEGGWPGSNPKDVEFFAAARSMTWTQREAGRLRLHAPQGQPRRGRPQPPRARGGGDPGRHDLRQDLAPARHRGAGRDAGREPAT